jgi:hypothetical protein
VLELPLLFLLLVIVAPTPVLGWLSSNMVRVFFLLKGVACLFNAMVEDTLTRVRIQVQLELIWERAVTVVLQAMICNVAICVYLFTAHVVSYGIRGAAKARLHLVTIYDASEAVHPLCALVGLCLNLFSLFVRCAWM